MQPSAHTLDPHRWQALTVVCVAFFMTVLDVSIVNVALPSIKTSLHVSESNLQWVLIAYTITFGGLLLLGGRTADLLGRRRMFMIGTALFAAASLACGLAGSIGVLVAARAVQGIGAAIISPATLSIIMTTFEEGSERNKALGIWGAMGGSGAAAGVLFGGILTKYAGWEWVFFVNVPVAVLVLAVTRAVVRESRITGIRAREAGLASGLINTSQQIGGALGVAIAATVAFTHTNTLLHAGHNPAAAQTGGFAFGFWVIAGFGAAAVLATLALVRSSEVALDVETAEAF